LNEEFDYVRAIDFSAHSNSLYSIADSGIVRHWDVNVGKVVADMKLPLEVRKI
jgi:WD40 repeat protein